jgi:hypothetical protein
MTPPRSSSIRKMIAQTALGALVLAAANASLAATAVIKVNISLPQVLTTSLSSEADLSSFNDSKNNGQLVLSDESEMDGKPVTYLYIQT